MNFSQAVRAVFSKYATFDGRARRAEYWYFSLFLGLVYVAISVIGVLGGDTMTSFAAVLQGVIALGTLLPTLAVTARRLHDTGRSGWWMLLSLVPIVGLILLVWYCTRGTLGTNRFGADPVA